MRRDTCPENAHPVAVDLEDSAVVEVDEVMNTSNHLTQIILSTNQSTNQLLMLCASISNFTYYLRHPILKIM